MGSDNADNRNEQNLLRQGYEGREDAKGAKNCMTTDPASPAAMPRRVGAEEHG